MSDRNSALWDCQYNRMRVICFQRRHFFGQQATSMAPALQTLFNLVKHMIGGLSE
jgi:hypothetical protein